MQKFKAKKARILEELSQPGKDASPKGSVDSGVLDLVQQINETSTCVTTSSCAGRIAVYLDGAPKPSATAENGVGDQEAASAASGGKGGGRWFFTSHDPVDLESSYDSGGLFQLLGLGQITAKPSFPTNSAVPFVHLKFEPMILHILCTSAQVAQQVLTAASMSGFRESGISSLYEGGKHKDKESTPMVGVRSAGLAFDTIIAFQDEDGVIRPMVEEQYLRTLIELANLRFEKNTMRKERFRLSFISKVGEQSLHSDGTDG